MADLDSAPPAVTRTDRRRERTRSRLTEATRSLIAHKGVSGLRINEITERADVALGSFYNHFASKEEAVETVVADSLRELSDALATRSDEDQDPAELVSTAIRRFVQLAHDDADFARLVVHLNHADALFATSVHPAARRAVQLGVDAGRFEVGDVAMVVTSIVGGAMALMRGILDGRVGEGAPAAQAEAALRVLGLAPDEARRIAYAPLDAGPPASEPSTASARRSSGAAR